MSCKSNNLDPTSPRVWDTWEVDGTKFIIQDLPPEDDDKALNALEHHFISDEVLCSSFGMDQESVTHMLDFWKKYCLPKRNSLVCYAEKDGQRTLAGLNVCYVKSKQDNDSKEINDAIKGKAWRNVYDCVSYIENKFDVFEYLKVDKVLYALGLCVVREYRGAKLGARILEARRPLSLSMGVTATSTIFTGPASQKCAERVGFETVAVVTFNEFADAGFSLPRKDATIKLMVKKFI